VDFELSADQEALREGMRNLCAGRFPIERIRALEGGPGVDRDAWRELGEAGVFALRLPESDGGVGLGCADAALVFEELGRSLIPGPLIWTHLAAGVIDGASTGDVVVGGIERALVPIVIEHLDALDHLVVLDDDGVWVVDPADLRAAASSVPFPLDPLTPLHNVASLPRGEQVASPDTSVQWRLEGAALTSSLLLGLASAVTDLAVAYAKERQQFDRPIGSFQAVKHILADMLTRAEVARAAVYAAGVTLDDPEVGDVRRAVAAAKVVAGEAAYKNGKAAIQVHGGMGFTWEVAAHLYLKRACVLDTVFGSVDEQAEVMAAFL
jgi:alkylation response protein AidB-like acyl-CoA dehydrogenase